MNAAMAGVRLLLVAATAAALAGCAPPAGAQKQCIKGKPCGATCIAREKTCRVGQESDGAAATVMRSPAPPPARVAGVCVIQRVVDGDTIRCEDGRRVRLLLIDAPERDQGPFGALAAAELERLLPRGTAVMLETDVQKHDRYGRLLAYLHLPDGRLVNEEMLRAGFAIVSVYVPNVQHVDRFRAAQKEAEAGRRGLWATPAFACEPAAHRRGACD